jgi:hypothetical protein
MLQNDVYTESLLYNLKHTFIDMNFDCTYVA